MPDMFWPILVIDSGKCSWQVFGTLILLHALLPGRKFVIRQDEMSYFLFNYCDTGFRLSLKKLYWKDTFQPAHSKRYTAVEIINLVKK